MKNKYKLMIITAAVLILAGASCFYFRKIWAVGNSQTALTEGEKWKGSRTNAVQKDADRIAIPGFESLTLTADTKEQQVNFYNPEQNVCYFKLSLLLNGEVIWQSQLLEPNNGIYKIELTKELSEGFYEEGTLKYECFSLDEDRSPLNGSEIKFPISVI